MNKETFIALMAKSGWEHQITDYTNTMSPKDSPKINMDGSIEFWRGSYGVFTTDDKVEELKDENFDNFFMELTKGFHFWDDWKKDFKGSEFLIPTVEKEMETRKRLLTTQFWSKLMGMKEGFFSLDRMIAEYQEQLEEKK